MSISVQQHGYGNPSLRSRLMSLLLKKTFKSKITRSEVEFSHLRKAMEKQSAGKKHETGVEVNQVGVDGVKGEWQIPHAITSGLEDACFLYLHGGGYAFCSPMTHRPMTTAIAKRAGIRVFSLDYRLAPEHPFPAPVEDAVAAYQWLLNQGIKADRIVIAGDSAGGGLSMALMLALKQRQIALPAGAILLSPWTDMTVSGDSHISNGKSCAMFNVEAIGRGASNYLAGATPTDPLASPLFGDLSGLPPLSVHVSDSEVLRDDSLRLTEQGKVNDLTLEIHVWKKQPHVWPIFYPFLPEAKRCINDMVSFIHQQLN
jgi:epsilon-lactone hydrolase